MDIKQINKKMEKMPPDLLSEVMNYIDYLVHKHSLAAKNKQPFGFSWEGSLSEVSKEYTAVELQHKASEWR